MKYDNKYKVGGIVFWKGRKRKIVDVCPSCRMIWVRVLGKKELIRLHQLK